MFWQMWPERRWREYSTSSTRCWTLRTRGWETSSIIWAPLTPWSTTSPRRRSQSHWWPILPIWRVSLSLSLSYFNPPPYDEYFIIHCFIFVLLRPFIPLFLLHFFIFIPLCSLSLPFSFLSFFFSYLLLVYTDSCGSSSTRKDKSHAVP